MLAFGSSFFPAWWSISLLGVDGSESPARAQCQVGQAPPQLHPVPMGPAGCGCQGKGEPELREVPVFLLMVVWFCFSPQFTATLGIWLPLSDGQCPDRVTGGRSPICTAAHCLSFPPVRPRVTLSVLRLPNDGPHLSGPPATSAPLSLSCHFSQEGFLDYPGWIGSTS